MDASDALPLEATGRVLLVEDDEGLGELIAEYLGRNGLETFWVRRGDADYVTRPRYHYRSELVNYERVLPDMVQAVPFGSGAIDYGAFFRGLVEGGFDGLASYEVCSPIRGGGSLANLDQCAAGYLMWMRQNVPSATGMSGG